MLPSRKQDSFGEVWSDRREEQHFALSLCWGSGLIITALNAFSSKPAPSASPDRSTGKTNGISDFGMASLPGSGVSARHEGMESNG